MLSSMISLSPPTNSTLFAVSIRNSILDRNSLSRILRNTKLISILLLIPRGNFSKRLILEFCSRKIRDLSLLTPNLGKFNSTKNLKNPPPLKYNKKEVLK